MNQNPDRRNDLRVEFEHPVKCMTPEVIFEGRAVNLGVDGLCLQCPVPLDIGTEMAIMFSYSLEGDLPFLALAEVIWCEDSGEEKAGAPSLIGLQFLNLSPQKESFLAWHVRQLALSGRLIRA